MRRQAIISTIEHLLEMRARGDDQALAAQCAPEALFWVAGDAAYFKWAGIWVGQAALRRSIQLLTTDIEILNPRLDEVLVDGDRAVYQWSSTVRSRGSSGCADLRGISYIRLQDGLIVESRQFYDTGVMGRVLSDD